MREGRLRVVEFASSLAAGGVERVVAEIAGGLDPRRFEAIVLLYDALGPLSRGLAARGIAVRLLRRRPGLDGLYPLLLAARLRRWRVDCLHAHNSTALFYGSIAARLAGVPCVYTEHDRSHPDRRRTRLLHHALAPLLARGVAVSSRLARDLARYEGFDPSRLEVVPNGVPACDAKSPAEARAALGIAPPERACLWAGHFTPVKDPGNLVRAFARVATPGARLYLAGEGPLRPAVEALAARLGVERRLVFLGLRLDLRELYRAFDLLVLASTSEGLPMTILEAISAGVPAVATDVGACAEVLLGSGAGLVVPPGNPEALAAAIDTILADPDRSRTMGARGREAHRARYTLEAMVERYARVLEEAAA